MCSVWTDESSLHRNVDLTGTFQRVAVADAYTVRNYDTSKAVADITPPGRVTDLQILDVHNGITSTGLFRYYTLAWTATGDNVNAGQGRLSCVNQIDINDTRQLSLFECTARFIQL